MQIQLPQELQNFLMENEVARREGLIARAKADPIAHKKTLQFDGRLGWRFFDAGVRRNRHVRFGWTTTRNAAGYFLSFREVRNVKTGVGERDQFIASKSRKLVKERALARYYKYRGITPRA